MDNRYQITIKGNYVKNYPVTYQMLDELSGSIRAKTLIATCEAFAKIEGMENVNPEVLYHRASEILLGYEPGDHATSTDQQNDPIPKADVSRSNRITEDELDDECEDIILVAMDSFNKGGNKV